MRLKSPLYCSINVGKLTILAIAGFSFLLASCLGVGKRLSLEESAKPNAYDRAFELALKSAKEMHEECRKINIFNYPAVVSLGTSKSRGVITVHYRFDPEAGSVCTKPPESISSYAKRAFVPHFGAEFYMHIRFLKEGDIAKGVKIEVTQSKGVKKRIFEEEMEKLARVYLSYLRRHWR